MPFLDHPLDAFRERPFASFAISVVIGFGAVLVLGLPDSKALQKNLASFAINLIKIPAAGVVSFAALRLRLGGRGSAPRSRR